MLLVEETLPDVCAGVLTAAPVALALAEEDVVAADGGTLRIPFLPISHPHLLTVLTNAGVTAAVKGTRNTMSALCTAYASASSVHMLADLRPAFSTSSAASAASFSVRCR